MYFYTYTHKDILLPLLNRKNEENTKHEIKILGKKIKNKSDVKKYIWHAFTFFLSLWLYTNEQLQRISVWILKYSAKLPNKHKIVNPWNYLITKMLNFKCPRPYPIPMKIAHLWEMHLNCLCPGRIQGNGSWRSIIMLKWFKKGDSLSWSLISTLAVSMDTEWSGAIYWTASPQLSSSLTCCLSTYSIPGSVLMQSGFLCD